MMAHFNINSTQENIEFVIAVGFEANPMPYYRKI